MTRNLQSTQAQGLGWVYSDFTYFQIAYSHFTYTKQVFVFVPDACNKSATVNTDL